MPSPGRSHPLRPSPPEPQPRSLWSTRRGPSKPSADSSVAPRVGIRTTTYRICCRGCDAAHRRTTVTATRPERQKCTRGRRTAGQTVVPGEDLFKRELARQGRARCGRGVSTQSARPTYCRRCLFGSWPEAGTQNSEFRGCFCVEQVHGCFHSDRARQGNIDGFGATDRSRDRIGLGRARCHHPHFP